MITSEIDLLNEEAWNLRRSDIKQAFTLAHQLVESSTELSYKKGLAEALRTLGACYWRFSDYAGALEKSMKSLDLFQEIGDKKGQAEAINNIGAVYAFLGDIDNRLKWNKVCLKIRKDIGDEEGVIGSLNNIGDTYLQKKDYENALKYFNEAFSKVIDSSPAKVLILCNLGETYLAMKELDLAKDHLKRAEQLAEATDYKSIILTSSLLLSSIENLNNHHATALDLLYKAEQLAVNSNSKEELYRVHLAYSETYELMGDLKKAFEHYKRYHSLHTEIFNENHSSNVKNIQFQYESERIKRETEMERLKNQELRRANQEIEKQRNEIEFKNKIVEQKNKDITDSINYARRIQQAILPPAAILKEAFKEHFVFYKPKDIVCGDFYWVEKKNGQLLFAAADCTGHGVPGAFMSLVSHNLLNAAVKESALLHPSDILNDVNKKLSHTLKQSQEESVHDGMDIGLCLVDERTSTLEFAGANNTLWIIRDAGLLEIKGDKIPVGDFTGSFGTFTNHQFKMKSGDILYLLTDGFPDQFGGADGKKFMRKQMKELLLKIHSEPLDQQKHILEETLQSWKGTREQVDDILVMGIKISGK